MRHRFVGAVLIFAAGHMLGSAAADLGRAAGCSIQFEGFQKTKIVAPCSAGSDALAMKGSFTVMMWVDPPHTPPGTFYQTLMSYGTHTGMRLGISTNPMTIGHCYPDECPYGYLESKLQYVDSSWPSCYAPLPKTPGWKHVAYIWENTTGVMRLYVNGEISCDIDYSTKMCKSDETDVPCIQYGNPKYNVWSDRMHLGDIPNWGSAYMGKMDEFSMHTRALSSAEVKASMHTQPDLSDPALMLHYSFDECDGGIARDSTGKWDGRHGDDVFDKATFGSSPRYVDSGAPVFGDASIVGTRTTFVAPVLPASGYESFSWSVLADGAVLSTDRVMKVTSVSAWNAELVVDGMALQEGSMWPVEKQATPRVVNAQLPPELIGLQLGYQEARAGWVELVYEVLNTSGSVTMSGGKMKVALNANQPPLLGNAGQAVRFDGVDDYLGNFEFLLKHKTWTNDSSIFGTYEPTDATPNPAVLPGASGAGNSKPVTVEFWGLSTKANLMAKQDIKTPGLSGMTVFTVGNSDNEGFGDSSCNLEQPYTNCGGRFAAHLPWTYDHPFAYFDYGWNVRGGAGRSSFDLQGFMNDWVHFSFTADPDANLQRMYANGQLVAESGSDGPLRDLHGIFIGANPQLLSTHMGDIDEFRVYERAKTQSEIQADMHRRADPNDPDLLGYWHFDDCGHDGPVKSNCEDVSKYGRPMTSAVCGQIWSSSMTPGWGSQPGANSHDLGARTQLINCKRFKKPMESDKSSWPRGVLSEAPIAAHRAALQPKTLDDEEAGEFTVVIDALDADFSDDLVLEVVAMDAPQVVIHDADGNTLQAGSHVPMVRQLGVRHAMNREASLKVTVPADAAPNLGSITLRANDGRGGISSPVSYAISGVVCGPGSEYNVLGLSESRCLPCSPGSFSPGNGGLCQLCSIGMYAPNGGQVECDAVPPGTMGPDSGMTMSTLCAAGTYAPQPGSTSCDLCPVGTYQGTRGNAACVPCNGSLSTRYPGSDSAEACTCPFGSYLSKEGGCIPCPEGMTCDWGAAEENYASDSGPAPMLEEGYYSTSSDPLEVYLCLDKKVCTGGMPGTCTNGRRGILCASCPDGEALTANGCSKCSDSNVALLVLLIPILLFALGVVYWLTRSTLTANATLFMACGVMFGMFFTSAQVLASLRQLSVVWPSSVQGWLGASSVTLLDTDSISVECVLASDPLQRYLPRALAPYIVIAAAFLLFALSHIVCHFLKRNDLAWTFDQTLNTLGSIFQAIFTAATATVAGPLQCYSHPNGKKSVVSYPDVICGDATHTPLVVLAVIVMVTFVLPFVGACVWGVMAAPRLSLTGRRVSHFSRFYFLLARYRPEAWWWGVVFTLRQTLLAFAPMVPSDDPHAQVLYVVVVLCIYITVCAACWPWKSHELNIVDNTTMFFLVIIIVALGSFMPASTWHEGHSSFMLFIFVALVLSCGGMIMVAFGSMARKGLWGDFPTTNSYIRNVVSLADAWKELCDKSATQSTEYFMSVFETMNDFDRQTAMKAVGAMQSARNFLRSDKPVGVRRLTGLKRYPFKQEVPESDEPRMRVLMV